MDGPDTADRVLALRCMCIWIWVEECWLRLSFGLYLVSRAEKALLTLVAREGKLSVGSSVNIRIGVVGS